MEINIEHKPTIQQFVANIQNDQAILAYTIAKEDKILDYRSTFVPNELRGKGIGEALVKFALEYAKRNNFKIIPTCSFIKSYIDRHPEWLFLVQNSGYKS